MRCAESATFRLKQRLWSVCGGRTSSGFCTSRAFPPCHVELSHYSGRIMIDVACRCGNYRTTRRLSKENAVGSGPLDARLGRGGLVASRGRRRLPGNTLQPTSGGQQMYSGETTFGGVLRSSAGPEDRRLKGLIVMQGMTWDDHGIGEDTWWEDKSQIPLGGIRRLFLKG